MKPYVFLYRLLAVCSFGFYVHPMSAFENPAHPKTVEEMQAEEDENNIANQQERRTLDLIDPEHAPHTEQDRKNFAQYK